ncbi:MAG: hypothetical protein ACON5N_16580 [Akkermansiaceae bacterium]
MTWIDLDLLGAKSYDAGMKVFGLLLVTTGLMHADLSSARLFWTDKDLGRIETADLDGGNRTVVLAGLVDPRGIAIDVANDHIYWASHSSSGAIYRMTCEGTALEIFVGSLNEPADLELDLENRMIYWAAEGGNSIQRASLDDPGTVETLVTGLNRPYYLEVDGGFIYWSDFDSGIIHRRAIGGGGTPPYVFISGLSRVRDIEIDEGWIYWCDRESSDIRRRALDGVGTGTVLYSGGGIDRPHGLVLDRQSGQLCWTDTRELSVSVGAMDGVGSRSVLPLSGLDGPWEIVVARPLATGDPWEAWQAGHFKSEDLEDPTKEAMVWGASADPDGDGNSNTLEYAQGTDPNSTVVKERTLRVLPGDSVEIEFRIRMDDPSLNYQLQGTEDLESGPWNSGLFQEVARRPDPDNAAYEYVVMEVTGETESLFARLQVSR